MSTYLYRVRDCHTKAIPAQEERLRQPMAQQAASFPQAEVVLSYAGSLNAVINDDIGPGFTTVTGFPLTNISGPSVKLANQIRSGHIQPDVFMSADAEVNQVLMERENGAVAPWYFTMCRQRMVIAYSPLSRFKADFEAARLVQSPGMRCCRRLDWCLSAVTRVMILAGIELSFFSSWLNGTTNYRGSKIAFYKVMTMKGRSFMGITPASLKPVQRMQ